jgi:serine/threonine-protein kinase HipA
MSDSVSVSRRELRVLIEGQEVGRLHENSGVWSFAYEQDWLEDGYPLAPGLPLQQARLVDSGSTRPVQWYFDNLLPEEMARQRLEASLEKGVWDAWSLLERFGSESAGAVTLLAPGKALDAPGLRPLNNAQLEARIQQMPFVPLGSAAPKKMSLAGAQEKLPVVLDKQGDLYEPIGSELSTHILKPNALSAYYPASAVNEWYCARIAQRLKLNVPEVHLRYVPSAVYFIERFDRQVVNGVLTRRHVLDAAQALSLSAGSKYALAGAEALNKVVSLCRAKAPTRIGLFRWTVFNILIGNHDAHLKNLSLFAGREGYSLAPHYDFVSTVSWARPDLVPVGPRWPDLELTHTVGEARFFADLRRRHIFEFGEAIQLPATIVKRELDRLLDQIIPTADLIYDEFAQRSDVPNSQLGSQLYMINCIRSLPVKEMVAQLQA